MDAKKLNEAGSLLVKQFEELGKAYTDSLSKASAAFIKALSPEPEPKKEEPQYDEITLGAEQVKQLSEALGQIAVLLDKLGKILV